MDQLLNFLRSNIILVIFLIYFIILFGFRYTVLKNNDRGNIENNTIAGLFAIAMVSFFYALFYLVWSFSKQDIVFPNMSLVNLRPNEQGDAIGGLMNAIIGICISSFTALAFYAQFDANKQVQNQFKIQQFESQFYELLKLYENIVQTIEYNGKKGKKAFEELYNELKLVDSIIQTLNIDKSIKLSYMLFYNGLKGSKNQIRELKAYNDSVFINSINKNLESITNYNESNLNNNLFRWLYTKKGIRHNENFVSIISKNSILGHYYRHLFHIVEFVVNQNGKVLDYKEKRKYLRILRTQMSDIEQALLFYNWLAGYDKNFYGARWEERIIEEKDETILMNNREKFKNYYFSDYRMIRNVFQEHIFDKYGNKIYKTLSNLNDIENITDGRLSDNIFEYMDYSNN